MVELPTVSVTEETGRYAACTVADGIPAASMAVTIRMRTMER
jgi:hypothetical protein